LTASERKQRGLDTQIAPVKEIKAIKTQVEPQVLCWQQGMDTKATMAVTSPATSSVPAQTVAYTVLVQPPAPALSA
jgi:hypothetical protein